MTYQLLASGSSVHRVEDNAYIPFDPANADYQAYLAWLAEGNTPLPADKPATDLWEALRAERDRRLAETDWVVIRAVDLSNDGLGIQLEQVWVNYRQALRDLPANTTDPANPVWPVKPTSH